MRVVMLGPFGLHPKATMLARALPMARALGARGHDVTLIMPPWHTPYQAGRTWSDEREPRVRLEYLALAGLKVPVFGHALVAARMARRAYALAPDVVHVFKPKAYGGLAAWLLYQFRRPILRTILTSTSMGQVPLVVDTDDWEGPGGWNDLEPYSAAQRQFFAWQERWCLTHADHVIVASRALQTLAWAQGVPPSGVTYLPNALNVVIAHSPASTLPRPGKEVPRVDVDAIRRPTLLLYTRFFEFDLRRPLSVLAEVRAMVPAARLVVVGKGLFGEEASFLRLAFEMGLADDVDYRGWVDAEALADAIAQADIGLYPFDDNLINRTKSSAKVLELLSHGLPVVADRVGELAEVIEDGTCGRLVKAGDVGAMANAAAELLSDPAKRRRMSDGARQRTSAHFTWDRQVVDLEAVYGAALKTLR